MEVAWIYRFLSVYGSHYFVNVRWGLGSRWLRNVGVARMNYHFWHFNNHLIRYLCFCIRRDLKSIDTTILAYLLNKWNRSEVPSTQYCLRFKVICVDVDIYSAIYQIISFTQWDDFRISFRIHIYSTNHKMTQYKNITYRSISSRNIINKLLGRSVRQIVDTNNVNVEIRLVWRLWFAVSLK